MPIMIHTVAARKAADFHASAVEAAIAATHEDHAVIVEKNAAHFLAMKAMLAERDITIDEIVRVAFSKPPSARKAAGGERG